MSEQFHCQQGRKRFVHLPFNKHIYLCTHLLTPIVQEIDTALLKLLAEKRSQAVVDMVSTGDPQFSVQECAAVLEQYKVCDCLS